MTTATHTTEKIDELYELIADIEIALMTTRRPDGHLVSRPMASQERDPVADLWFVTNIETHKTDELEHDPNVNLGYLDEDSMEWVSVSGSARISQDRELIRRLHDESWAMWFDDEGGARDGGPDDPRLALILVDAHSAVYSKQKHSAPRTLFELAKGHLTGEQPDVAREEMVSEAELKG